MSPSRRCAAVAVLLLMTAGRIAAVTCDIACAKDPAAARSEANGATRQAGDHCHEPSAAASIGTLVPAPHGRCAHDAGAPATTLAAKSTVRSGAFQMIAMPQFALVHVRPTRLSARQLREHTPPGVQSPAVVALRI